MKEGTYEKIVGGAGSWVVGHFYRWYAILKQRLERVFIELGNNVCGLNILARFVNQSNPYRHVRVIVLQFSVIGQINLVLSKLKEFCTKLYDSVCRYNISIILEKKPYQPRSSRVMRSMMKVT